MKLKVFLICLFLFCIYTGNAQSKISWEKWSWLIGEWEGEGDGQPGQGGGTFSFNYQLDQNIIVRKSHSEYPASENRPATIHDDLMVVYPDNAGNPINAIYFDNEGHTINYTITYAVKSIILTSQKNPNVPVFRLTYSLLENNAVNTKFEMAPDGENFVTYIEGKSKKIN